MGGSSVGELLREAFPLNPLAAAVVDAPAQPDVRRLAGAVELQQSLTGPVTAAAVLLDVTFEVQDLVLHTMRGGRFEAAYPPAAYSTSSRAVHPGLPFPWNEHHSTVELGSELGRSSDAQVPFFWLGDVTGQHSLFFAVGWSGYWRARFTKLRGRAAHRLVVTALDGDLTVAPGEQVTLPRLFVGAGGPDGWRAVRDFLSRMRPTDSAPAVVYNSFFNESLAITADRLRGHLAVARELGVEVFTIDAGWYDTKGRDGEDFQTAGIGSWVVDEGKFPAGLRAFADEVHEAGLAFGLWFDPERAHPDSDVATAHPDWLTVPEGDQAGVLDLGIDAARAWVLDTLSDAVAAWSVDWLKWDFNTEDVRKVWRGDAARELGHVRGVYAVLDELRARHPSLRIEMCAGGGNRVDVEMLARSDSFWISDQTISPPVVRETVVGALRLLPAQYCYLSLSPQLQEPREDYPDAWFLGVMPGVMGLMERLSEWSPALRARAAEHISRFKQVRHLLDGELTVFESGQRDAPLAAWRAWEIATDDDAVLFAFRQLSPTASMVFQGRQRWEVQLEPEGAAMLTTLTTDEGVS